MGVAARQVERNGKTWSVRCFRFRRPPWRAFAPDFGIADPDEGLFATLPFMALYLAFAPFTFILIPLLVFLFELPAEAIRSISSDRCWVEALCEGPPRTQMTWVTSAEVAEAVVDQVARQLELGYSKVEPHRARFLGFGP